MSHGFDEDELEDHWAMHLEYMHEHYPKDCAFEDWSLWMALDAWLNAAADMADETDEPAEAEAEMPLEIASEEQQ